MLECLLVEGRLWDGLPMRIWIAGHGGKLLHAGLHDDEHPCTEQEFTARCGIPGVQQGGDDILQQAAREVREYFAGRRLQFEVPLELVGTPFQVRVWSELLRIPYGQVRSYGELAEVIGAPQAPRAVGSANGRNHLPVFVPCHRVIARGGKLGGYTGGIGLKKRLLAHESAVRGKARGA